MVMNKLAIEQRIDFTRLKPVLDGLNVLLFHHVGGQEIMQQLSHLKRAIDGIDRNMILKETINYASLKSFGRVYPTNGRVKLMWLKKRLLRLVAPINTYEIDIKSCHPTLLKAWIAQLLLSRSTAAKKAYVEHLGKYVDSASCLSRMISERDMLTDSISAHYTFKGASPDQKQAKKLLISILYGSTTNGHVRDGWGLSSGAQLTDTSHAPIIQDLMQFKADLFKAMELKLSVGGLTYERVAAEVNEANRIRELAIQSYTEQLQENPTDYMLQREIDSLKSKRPHSDEHSQTIAQLFQNLEFCCLSEMRSAIGDAAIYCKHDAIGFSSKHPLNDTELAALVSSMQVKIKEKLGIDLKLTAEAIEPDAGDLDWIKGIESYLAKVSENVPELDGIPMTSWSRKRKRFEDEVEWFEIATATAMDLRSTEELELMNRGYTYEHFVRCISDTDKRNLVSVMSYLEMCKGDLSFDPEILRPFQAAAGLSLHGKISHLAELYDTHATSELRRFTNSIAQDDYTSCNFRENGYAFEITEATRTKLREAPTGIEAPPATESETTLAHLKTIILTHWSLPNRHSDGGGMGHKAWMELVGEHAAREMTEGDNRLIATLEAAKQIGRHVGRVCAVATNMYGDDTNVVRETGLASFYTQFMQDIDKAKSNYDYFLQRSFVLRNFTWFDEMMLLRYCEVAHYLDRFFMEQDEGRSFIEASYQHMIEFVSMDGTIKPAEQLLIKVMREHSHVDVFVQAYQNIIIHLQERILTIQRTTKGVTKSTPFPVHMRNPQLAPLMQGGRCCILRQFLTTPSPIRSSFEQKIKRGSCRAERNGWYSTALTIQECTDFSRAQADLDMMWIRTRHLRGNRDAPTLTIAQLMDRWTEMLCSGGKDVGITKHTIIKEFRRFFAYILLFPNSTKKVMLYLKGPQGCGKDMLFQLCCGLVLGNQCLVGDTTQCAVMACNTAEDLLPESWNDHFKDAVVIVSTDNSFVKRAHSEQLKGSVTNEQMMVKQRFKSVVFKKNRMAYVFLGNTNNNFPRLNQDQKSDKMRRLLAVEASVPSSYSAYMFEDGDDLNGEAAYRREIIDAFMDDCYNPLKQVSLEPESIQLLLDLRKTIVRCILQWATRQIYDCTDATGLPAPVQTAFVAEMLQFSAVRSSAMLVDAFVDCLGAILLYLVSASIPAGFGTRAAIEAMYRSKYDTGGEHDVFADIADPMRADTRRKTGIFIEENSLNAMINNIVPNNMRSKSQNHDAYIRTALSTQGFITNCVNPNDTKEIFVVKTYWNANNLPHYWLDYYQTTPNLIRVYEVTSSGLNAMRTYMANRNDTSRVLPFIEDRFE